MTLRASILAVLLFASATFAAAAEPDRSFRAGIEAFQAERYEQALVQFEAAHEAGMRRPQLFYNLGATYFRLGDYDNARTAFQRIADDEHWGALAHYNLGVIAERSGHLEQAQRHFRLAFERADSPRTRALAENRLRTITVATRPAEDPGWIGLVSLASGYDDNVLLTDDEAALGFADEDDFFLELFGVASRYVHGDVRNGWRLDLVGYYRGHSDLDEFDVGLGSVGLTHTRRIGEWRLQGGAKAELQFAGREHFTTNGSFQLQGRRDVGIVTLRARNEFTYLDGASDFDHFSGWRNRMRLDATPHWNGIRLRLGYELELNDRDDLVREDGFSSFSPTRHKLFGDATFELSPQVELSASGEHRWSRYDDANVFFDENEVLTRVTRDEQRLRARLRLAVRPGGAWSFFGEYQYTDNDANIDRFGYQSNQITLGIDRNF